jgi:hypothetical protein
MATETETEYPRVLDRVRWGALFAGFFVGLGSLVLLLLLGGAVGFTALDPRDLSSWKSLGIGAGIWAGISAIIASFFGAWVAARLSTAVDRGNGLLHGLALWGLAWAVGIWFSAMAVGGAVSGAASAVGGAASAAGGALAGSGVSASGVVDQAAQQANAWLQEHGKPAVPPAQMQAAVQDILGKAVANVRQGKSPAQAFDHASVVGSVARTTNLSRADADALANQLESQLQGAVQEGSQKAGEIGEAAASGAKAGTWGAFLAALFTMLAAMIGGATGVPERARREGALRRRILYGQPAPQHG